MILELYVHVTVHRNKFLFHKNQPDALISQIYFVKNFTCFGHFLCPSSGVFYYTFGIGIFHAGLMTASKKGQDPAWKLSSNRHEICQCRMYSRKLLMMGRGNARNM